MFVRLLHVRPLRMSSSLNIPTSLTSDLRQNTTIFIIAMRRFLFQTTCLAFLFSVGTRSTLFADPPVLLPPPQRVSIVTPQWEYLVVSEETLLKGVADLKLEPVPQPYERDLTAALSSKGREGWELVTIAVSPGGNDKMITSTSQYVFKRPKP